MKLIKIGSNPQCDIVLRSNTVSALHAEIVVLNNGDILLEDKNSTNGTYVMNQRIQPGTSVSIKRGDVIRFADVELPWAQVPYLKDSGQYKKMLGIGSNYRNEIQINGPTVSRFHATLKVDNKGRAFIEDHSMNGTQVNGNRIPSNQDFRVKRGDSVVIGGVPVDLKQYIGSNSGATLLKVLGAVAAVALIVLVSLQFVNGNWGGGKTKSIEVLANAVPIVYGAYYIDVTIEDDPLSGLFSDWPEKWSFGVNNEGKFELINGSSSEVEPIAYTGTAFFISEYGEMGTNRHIAAPWEYHSNSEYNEIRQKMEEYILETIEEAVPLFTWAAAFGQMEAIEATAILSRLSKSKVNISGHHEYLGIAMPSSNISSISDLINCQVISESGDENKDVAILRLNSQQTPEYVVKHKCYFNLEKARLDETKLKLGEPLRIIGYPGGLGLGVRSSNGDALNPSIHNTTISRVPNDYDFQVQTVGLGGQSGSPVIDAKGNLVGVFYGGISNNEISYCCNIKHLVELYNKCKVKR